MGTNARESILEAAKRMAMARGYAGLNFRDLAGEVGIKAPSLYHYFPTKADLGAAVAKRYWEDTRDALETIGAAASTPLDALRRYPDIFRASLANHNRMCLSSFMAAEYDDLPAPVREEVQAFADVNVAWLSRLLTDAEVPLQDQVMTRARAIYAAVAGAQLLARGRSDTTLFDTVIASYRCSGLLPG